MNPKKRAIGFSNSKLETDNQQTFNGFGLLIFPLYCVTKQLQNIESIGPHKEGSSSGWHPNGEMQRVLNQKF